MKPDILTQPLAIWGAVTGTIGTVAGIANLILRYKEHKRDQPKLVCTSDFSFEHSSGEARPMHKIILRSVGKRPVTVDFIRYCIEPKSNWQRVFKRRAWANRRWVYDDTPRNPLHITEGKKEDIRINLPSGLTEKEISKVEVHDQSGAVWPVKWPSRSKLIILTNYEKLHNSEEINEDRLCKISGYTASGSFHIYLHWNPTPKNKNTFKGKFFHFTSRAEYDQKLINLIEVQQPKLLRCEVDEIE